MTKCYLDRIHQAIMAQTKAGGFKGNLLAKAINTKVENYRKTGEVTHTLYDALVFRKVSFVSDGLTSATSMLSNQYDDGNRCEPSWEERCCSLLVVVPQSPPKFWKY
jgi:hypothetical protein